MGAILVLLTVGILWLDQYLVPWYPFLFVFVLALEAAACWEMIALLGPNRKPAVALCFVGTALLGIANWLGHMPWLHAQAILPWTAIIGVYMALILAVFVWEMMSFVESGRAVERMAVSLLLISYLGLLPCCLVQLRWVSAQNIQVCGTALALAIFVPKCCDIGAYCTGRLIGRHKMTPVLSPKKTWEGAAGGLIAACLATLAINRLTAASVLPVSFVHEIAFGLAVGATGMCGDLAESLIKRDCMKKDASSAVPGFGGILDVVDSVLFSAPVSYFLIMIFSVDPFAG